MHHVSLDARADLAADLPQRRGRALTRRLMDVIQHQPIDRAILGQEKERTLRADFLMAMDVAHGHAAADRALVKTEKGTAVSTVICFKGYSYVPKLGGTTSYFIAVPISLWGFRAAFLF